MNYINLLKFQYVSVVLVSSAPHSCYSVLFSHSTRLTVSTVPALIKSLIADWLGDLSGEEVKKKKERLC